MRAIEFISLLVIPTASLGAAVAACVVAAVQVRVARRAVRLGLYERRLDVFDACQRLLDECTNHMDRTDEESNKAMRSAVSAFFRNTAQAAFIFPPPMREYINGIRVLAADLRGVAKQRKAAQEINDDQKLKALMHEDGKLVGQLMKYDGGMRDQFAKFLDFSDD